MQLDSIFDDDRPKDECGVFGIFGHRSASELAYLGLRALQHRGQESAGIVASQGQTFSYHRGMGLVTEVFNDMDILAQLEGHLAIGHNRYSTAGSSNLENAQPLVRQYSRGPLAIAHNGNLVNAYQIRTDLEKTGSIFNGTSDTEVIAHLIARSQQLLLEDRIIDTLQKLQGAYSLVFMGKSIMIGARDPNGFRPLWLGRLGDAYILASETCAFDVTQATPIREIEPGEMVVITSTSETPKSFRVGVQPDNLSQCIFEYIYLARPDSIVFNNLANQPRREFGRQLAREHPVEADIVIPVPDSATIATLGFSEESETPFEFGLYRNPYVGRTFMHPSQEVRDLMVRIKLNPIENVLKGKRVVVVDDSIMRGTNSRKIVSLVRQGGATEVHFRVSSPPNCYPCFYGVDTPTRKELIASSWTIDEICKYIGADSLGYLSIEGMLNCVVSPKDFCTACFDGKYPVEFSGQPTKQLPIEFDVKLL